MKMLSRTADQKDRGRIKRLLSAPELNQLHPTLPLVDTRTAVASDECGTTPSPLRGATLDEYFNVFGRVRDANVTGGCIHRMQEKNY